MNKNARWQAWQILVQVFQNQGFSHLLLNKIAIQKLDLKTKNLIFTLVHGTLTYQIYLDYVTKKLINPQKTPFKIQVLFWMSLYQLHFLSKTPNYAVVNEAVEIAKKIRPQYGGLVNATLKNAIQNPKSFLIDDVKNPEQKFCLEYAFPWTLFQKIKIDFGQEIAQKMAIDSLQKPSISFRINQLKINLQDFKNQYWEKWMQPSHFVETGILSSQAIINSQLYQKGLITIQDQASILVGAVASPQLQTRFLDMCSAPGGKLTHLAALMQNSGEIVAYEISSPKIRLIQENLLRLGVQNVTLINDDVLTINDDQKFDGILLDAPCSGIGVIKRKPEIKLNFTTQKFADLVRLQADLLIVAYKNLKVGGYLTYSTCTVNRDENQNQIVQFLIQHPDMQVISEQQLFGFENNNDGFYICKLQKTTPKFIA